MLWSRVKDIKIVSVNWHWRLIYHVFKLSGWQVVFMICHNFLRVSQNLGLHIFGTPYTLKKNFAWGIQTLRQCHPFYRKPLLFNTNWIVSFQAIRFCKSHTWEDLHFLLFPLLYHHYLLTLTSISSMFKSLSINTFVSEN